MKKTMTIMALLVLTTPQARSDDLHDCWERAAERYATKICLPPRELLGTIYGACDDIEQQQILEDAKDPRYSTLGIDELRRLREEVKRDAIDNRIQKLIVDIRIEKSVCIR